MVNLLSIMNLHYLAILTAGEVSHSLKSMVNKTENLYLTLRLLVFYYYQSVLFTDPEFTNTEHALNFPLTLSFLQTKLASSSLPTLLT